MVCLGAYTFSLLRFFVFVFSLSITEGEIMRANIPFYCPKKRTKLGIKVGLIAVEQIAFLVSGKKISALFQGLLQKYACEGNPNKNVTHRMSSYLVLLCI